MKNLFTKICFLPISIILLSSLKGEEKKESHKSASDLSAYGEIDYLLWFANPNGLKTPTVATGKSPNLGSEFNSGVKAALGIQASSWDTQACYYYYSTSPQAKATAEIATILSSSPSTAGIYSVGESWKLNLNRLDLEFGRRIFFGDWFLLRPFFGLQGIDAGQTFDLDVRTVFLDLETGLQATQKSKSDNTNSLLSIGAKAGSCVNIQLGSEFGFYGNFALNLLWGSFDIKQKYSLTDAYSDGSSDELVNQTRNTLLHDSIFSCDLALGADWKHVFSKKKIELLLKAGWEQHFYSDMVRFQDFYLQQTSLGTAAYNTQGNLSLSGFNFGISVKY